MNVGLEHFDTSLILVTCGSFFYSLYALLLKKLSGVFDSRNVQQLCQLC